MLPLEDPGPDVQKRTNIWGSSWYLRCLLPSSECTKLSGGPRAGPRGLERDNCVVEANRRSSNRDSDPCRPLASYLPKCPLTLGSSSSGGGALGPTAPLCWCFAFWVFMSLRARGCEEPPAHCLMLLKPGPICSGADMGLS